MRTLSIAISLVPLWTVAQVTLDAPLRMTGQGATIQGLAAPEEGSAMLNVGYALSGAPTWATASMVNNVVHLTLTPPSNSSTRLVRFAIDVVPNNGPLSIKLDDGPDLPWQYTDGRPVDVAWLHAGMVCEVLLHEGMAIHVAPSPRGCPRGSVRIDDSYCIDQNEGPVQSFYVALEMCANAGGHLCTWNEYYVACVTQGDMLQGLFNNWEWIDDTANHTHTQGQAGRFECMSVRSSSNIANAQGARRCCYPIR
jgi:hypothetical protein